MACNIPVQEGVRAPADCKCYSAVMRTYKAMVGTCPEHIAIEAAQRVYRHHHPEDTKIDAHLTVERWVTAESHVH